MSSEKAPRLAAPAPVRDDDEDHAIEAGAAGADRNLHEFCEDWAYWCRTRRFFGPPDRGSCLLGRLSGQSRPVRAGGPDGACSADLAAFHLAVLAQPRDALDRRVFEMHYLARVRNIKAAAAQMSIGRQHWYTLVADFRSRAYTASLEILRANHAAAAVLPHRWVV